MAIKSRSDGRKVTYDSIYFATRISKTTLSRLATQREKRVALDVMGRLCAFFGCQPGDLFVYLPESQC